MSEKGREHIDESIPKSNQKTRAHLSETSFTEDTDRIVSINTHSSCFNSQKKKRIRIRIRSKFKGVVVKNLRRIFTKLEGRNKVRRRLTAQVRGTDLRTTTT